jgi:hypothetical protein
VEQGVQLHIRLETRVAFQLPYELRAHIHQRRAAEVAMPEVVVSIHGLQPAEYGRAGNRPAVLEWSDLLPVGSSYGQCTLLLGKRHQRFLLRFAPPQIELVQQQGFPIAELVLP